MFRTHSIHWPFVPNAMSCMMQQLLLYYQIPQYDRHHFPVTGILLIQLTEKQTNKMTSLSSVQLLALNFITHFILCILIQPLSGWTKFKEKT